MWEALKICLPITLMTFAIFTRSDMVVNPGWPQIADTLLVLIGTCGITFAMFGRLSENGAIDVLIRPEPCQPELIDRRLDLNCTHSTIRAFASGAGARAVQERTDRTVDIGKNRFHTAGIDISPFHW